MNSYTHFYLYAKGWYKETNFLEDLKVIMADYSSVPKEKVDFRDIKFVLSYAVYPLLKTESSFCRFLSNVEMEGILRACISELGIAKVSDLGKPDFNILPPANNNTVDHVSDFKWSD